ncbi:DDE-type integrase/transposase/recombinase [Mesorhizobium sp. M0590]|uniref:DDE-type integrase/transposase/recombinase n=1 Tax=Mesorhizobium sp. M0590 TaxID=2956966 RepID=UPI00333DB69D
MQDRQPHRSRPLPKGGPTTALTPNQLWVSDITYVTIAAGFVYVAVILDAWSRKVVGYAIGRSIDARLTVAALKAAIERRKPGPRVAICRTPLPQRSRRARSYWIDGPARQSLR